MPPCPLAQGPEKQAVVADGRAAVTHFRVLERLQPIPSSVSIETGRTHQIQVHMKYINHPLAGDHFTAPQNVTGGRQYLHARLLGFQHQARTACYGYSALQPPFRP